MKNKKINKKVIISLFMMLFLTVLILPNVIVQAAEVTPVDWIKNNWLNYPSDIGKWKTTTINGNPAIGSTQNVDWSGYVNNFAMDTKDSVFEFKMYQNEITDDDNMGWTFRHNYINTPTKYANHSFYAFVTNGAPINGGNIPSGLYKKSYGTNIAWNPNHGMKLLKGFKFSRLPKTLYNIKIDVKDEFGGTRIKGYIDGVEVFDYLDTDPIPSGGYGPFSFSQANALYYDMNINGSSVYNIPPTISITSPSDNTSYNPKTNINVVGNTNDVDNRGTLSTYYKFDDRLAQLMWTKKQTGSPLPINENIPIPTDLTYGNHTLTIWSKDSENAESQKVVLNFSVKDITKPVATHTITSTSSTIKTININATDSESGVKSIILPNGSVVNSSKTSYQVPNKNNDYLFKISDNAGNVLDYTVTVSDASVIPTLKATAGSNLVSLSWNINDTWQTYAYNGFKKIQGSSSYSTIFTSKNTLSYSDTSAKDTAKPSKPNMISVNASGSKSTVSINYSQSTDYGTIYNHMIKAIGSKNGLTYDSNMITTEVKSGIKGYSIVVDNVSTTIPDNVIETTGTTYSLSKEINSSFYVHVAAIDNANNISEVEHYYYSDSFSPSLTLTPNTINWTKNNVTIVANASDNESGVKRIKLPNGTYINGDTATYSVSTNGTYKFLADDYFGNIFEKEIVVQNIDKTAPTVSHTLSKKPTNGWIDSDVTINITSSDSQSGIKRIKLPDNTYVNARTGAFKATVNKVYSFEIEDNAGNIKPYTVKIDNLSYKPTITATPNNKEDYINLKWGISDSSQPYTYKLYQDKNNTGTFQSISASNLKDGVKVLNIYPNTGNNVTFTNWKRETFTLPKSASLKQWMEQPNSEDSKGYGKGLIDVDPVLLATFNEDPNKYLKNSDGSWKYDVIMIGSWDSNAYKDVSDSSIGLLREFIESGRGMLLGHDTIGYLPQMPNLRSLSQYTNLIPTGGRYYNGYNTSSSTPPSQDVLSTISIYKKGLLTNYPWDIGDIGTKLKVPATHTLGQIANGDIWMKFNVNEYGIQDNANFYLTTWNNSAMIQTGHANGRASSDEQKLLANTLFYLSQLTSNTNLDDRSGQDINGPTNPTISNFSLKSGNVSLSYGGSVDNKTDYSYYVEALGQNNGVKTNSNIASTSITSGFKGYSYVIDTNANTIPDNVIESSIASSTTFKLTSKTMYFHIKAIDNVGNASETIHYKVEDNEMPTLTITGVPTEWTRDEVELTISATDNLSGVKHLIMPNGSIVVGSKTTYKIPQNGIYIFKSVDNVGNTTSKTIVIDKIDRTAPTLSYTKEFSSDKKTGFININTSDVGSGVDYIILPDNNKVTTTTFKYEMANNGYYTLIVYDKVGNYSINSILVTELNVPETPSGISKIEYKLEGATVKPWTTYTSPFEITNEGVTTITARAYDKANNLSYEKVSYARIDKTKPINNSIIISLN